MSRSLSPLQAVLLGVVILAGVALTTTALFAVGSGRWPWADAFHLRVGFREARGVEPGTRVRVQGIDAGEVAAVEPPAQPGEAVMFRLRLAGKYRQLIRADARAQIVAEGMVGGKVVEVDPGSPAAEPVSDDALIASRPTTELADVLCEVSKVLEDVRDGKGTIGKLAQDPEAYAALLALIQQSRDAATSIQQDAEALKRIPIVRSYVQDRLSLLVRPNCERHRQVLAEPELFDPGRAVLKQAGKQRLNEVAGWLAGLKLKGSEIVVAAYADPKATTPAVARPLTQQQSEAVCTYLKDKHSAHKLGWFSRRKLTPLGCATELPPEPEKESVPPARVEVVVFVPQK